MVRFLLILAIFIAGTFRFVNSHEERGEWSCDSSSGIRIQANFRSGIVTLDGHADDWNDVDGFEFSLLPALDPHEDDAYKGKMTVKALHDGKYVFFMLQVDGEYVYSKGNNKKCPSVALMFQVGEKATYHNMGGCHEAPNACTRKTCRGHEVDIMHFSIGNAIPGRLYGGNPIDNGDGNGGDRFGHLVDLYSWNPHCRYVDGISTSGNDSSAQNDWKGAWWHDSFAVHSGFVEEDSPYASVKQKGKYYFEFSRPLSTTDRLQQYIRPRAATDPNTAKTNESGVAVSLSSPLSSRGEWDVNGLTQQIGSNSMPISSSCTTAIPVVPQNEFNFSLPRQRTILDINIETFVRKPWRHPGVDITDFFNFGLDEESWKYYCDSLEYFWREATMQKRIPVHESLRPNQVYEAEFDYKTLAPEDEVEELAQIGQGDWWLETPKGRAIPVEGGIGERRPSMDVWRPQNRDSDVVIQIAVQDSSDDSSGSDTEEPMHADTSIRKVSENDGSYTGNKRDMHSAEFVDGYRREYDVSHVIDGGVCSLRRCSPPNVSSNASFLDACSQGNELILDVDVDRHQKVKEHVIDKSTGAIETLKSTKEGNNKNPSKADQFIVEAESPLGDQIQHSLSSSDLHSRSEALKDGVDIGMEKTQNRTKRPSPKSVTGLREAITSNHYRSKDSGSDENKTEHGDYKNDSGSPNPMQEEQNCCSRMKLRSVAKLKTQEDDEEAFSISDRKGRHGRDHLAKGHETLQGSHLDYDFYDGEELSYYRERKTSIGYQSQTVRFAKKQVRNSYTEVHHRKGHLHFRDESDPYPSRHLDEREPLEKRVTAKGNKVMQREHYLFEGGPNNEKMNSFAHEEAMRSTPEDSSFYAEKEKYPSHRRKRDYRHRSRNGTEDEDFVVEHRYREELIQEKYGRPVPYNSRERKYFHENSERRVPCNGREIRSSERKERYGGSPSLDLDTSRMYEECDDEYYRQPVDESLPSYIHRKSRNRNESRWRDATSPRNNLYASRKLDERYGDHRKHSEENGDSGWLDPKCKDDHDAYRTIYPDDHIFYEKRYSRQSKELYWVEDDSSSRHRNRGRSYAEEASFSCERMSRHEPIHINHDSAYDGSLLVENRLEGDRNRMIREENRNSEASNLVNSSFDVIDKHEQTELRRRYSVGLDLVGGKGKASGRSTEVRDVKHNGGRHNTDRIDARRIGRHENTDHRTIDKEQKKYAAQLHFPNVKDNCFKTIRSKVEVVGGHDLQFSTEKSHDNRLDKNKVTEKHTASASEEGQLVVKERQEKAGDAKEKRFHSKDAVDENSVVHGIDNHHILETLAKMERRRERFKEPISMKEPITLKEADKNPNPQCDLVIETADVKQQRPTRKRRWGVS